MILITVAVNGCCGEAVAAILVKDASKTVRLLYWPAAGWVPSIVQLTVGDTWEKKVAYEGLSPVSDEKIVAIRSLEGYAVFEKHEAKLMATLNTASLLNILSIEGPLNGLR